MERFSIAIVDDDTSLATGYGFEFRAQRTPKLSPRVSSVSVFGRSNVRSVVAGLPAVTPLEKLPTNDTPRSLGEVGAVDTRVGRGRREPILDELEDASGKVCVSPKAIPSRSAPDRGDESDIAAGPIPCARSLEVAVPDRKIRIRCWWIRSPRVRPLLLAAGSGISAPELHEKRASYPVLDVRDDAEFENEGHIPGASHLYVGYVEEHVDAIKPPLDKKRPIAVTCSVGHRAGLATSILLRQGFERVNNLLGGMTAWEKLELPREKGPKYRHNARYRRRTPMTTTLSTLSRSPRRSRSACTRA